MTRALPASTETAKCVLREIKLSSVAKSQQDCLLPLKSLSPHGRLDAFLQSSSTPAGKSGFLVKGSSSLH